MGQARSGVMREAGRDYRAAVVVIRGDGLGKRYNVVDELSIGWDAGRDVVLGDPDALQCARLRAEADGVVLEREPGSEILIRINEVGLDGSRRLLAHGDVVQVGFALLKFLRGSNQHEVDAAFHDEIFRLSTIDPVTQVYNRRYFTEAFEREVSRVRRYERSLSLVMIEVDGLSSTGGEWGPTGPDELMHGVADLVHARARESDVVGHYEREVLAVLLPEVGIDGAVVAAENLRARIESARFEVDGRPRACTVSIGVAELDPGHDTVDALVRLAATRLWVAKDSGGNRVVGVGG